MGKGKKGKRAHCAGCRDDYYNHPEQSGSGECWSLASALEVVRYRLGWWTRPLAPGAFTAVTTNSCHHAPGEYVDYKPEAVPAGATNHDGTPLRVRKG